MIDLSENCIGQWKMNDNAASTTVIDSSPNGYDGTAARNTDVLTQAGRINTALEFDESLNDGISLGTNPAIVGLQEFAVSVWVKLTTLGRDVVLVSQRASDSPNGQYSISMLNTDKPYFFVYNSGIGFSLVSDTAIIDNDWHLVIAQRINSTSGELYLDNNLVASGSGAARALLSVIVFVGRSAAGAYYLDGVEDDLRIWDGRFLSADERAFLWNNGYGTENLVSVARPLVNSSLAGGRKGLICI